MINIAKAYLKVKGFNNNLHPQTGALDVRKKRGV
jgi:hypothetical protein